MTRTTSVFVFGIEANALVEGQESLVRLPSSATLAHMAWVARKAESDAGNGEAHLALALRPDRLPSGSVRQLDTLRSTLFSSRLAVHATPLPPLAAGVLAGLAAGLLERLEPGVLFAGLPRLERELTALGWVDSVAGLDHPAPSGSQRVASRLPGSSFQVAVSPEPGVRRLSRPEPLEPPPASLVPARVLVAGRSTRPEWVREVVEPAFPEATIEDVELPETAAEWWGTRRVVEVVAYPTDLDALASRLSRGRSRTCHWCGAIVAGRRCPFCRQPVAPEEAARNGTQA
jgi:hypothetical protein